MQFRVSFAGGIFVIFFKLVPRFEPNIDTISSAISPLRHPPLFHTYFVGMMKCNNAHNSFKLFCNGVPVMSSRWLVIKSVKALYNNESSFFKRWASSTINTAQFKLPKNALSFSKISYVVKTALNFSLFEFAKHHSYSRIYENHNEWLRHPSLFKSFRREAWNGLLTTFREFTSPI